MPVWFVCLGKRIDYLQPNSRRVRAVNTSAPAGGGGARGLRRRRCRGGHQGARRRLEKVTKRQGEGRPHTKDSGSPCLWQAWARVTAAGSRRPEDGGDAELVDSSSPVLKGSRGGRVPGKLQAGGTLARSPHLRETSGNRGNALEPRGGASLGVPTAVRGGFQKADWDSRGGSQTVRDGTGATPMGWIFPEHWV